MTAAPLPEVEAARFRRWAVTQALPLWAGRGFDASSGHFEEQLSWERQPVLTVPRRSMVQARQISVYALAALNGWGDGRGIALAAGDALLERFWARDGAPGWAFSLHRDGSLADGRRDLYGHAFVLFALAWLLKLSPERRFLAAIEQTVALLDERFADPRSGGFWDALPRLDAFRRQNPHMHLLEAWLELYEATGERHYLRRAAEIVQLAQRAFAAPERGALREIFDDGWAVMPGPGKGSVEPGHNFEWAWLLRRFEAMSGASHGELIEPLIRFALIHGVDRRRGRIVEELGEDGALRKASSRSWPHAEALKCLALETAQGAGDYRADIAALLQRLRRVYCLPALEGGWVDQVDEQDRPKSRMMPASSLYHFLFAFAEVERCLGGSAARVDAVGTQAIEAEASDTDRTNCPLSSQSN